jgi:hypothetical protein
MIYTIFKLLLITTTITTIIIIITTTTTTTTTTTNKIILIQLYLDKLYLLFHLLKLNVHHLLEYQ